MGSASRGLLACHLSSVVTARSRAVQVDGSRAGIAVTNAVLPITMSHG